MNIVVTQLITEIFNYSDIQLYVGVQNQSMVICNGSSYLKRSIAGNICIDIHGFVRWHLYFVIIIYFLFFKTGDSVIFVMLSANCSWGEIVCLCFVQTKIINILSHLKLKKLKCMYVLKRKGFVYYLIKFRLKMKSISFLIAHYSDYIQEILFYWNVLHFFWLGDDKTIWVVF